MLSPSSTEEEPYRCGLPASCHRKRDENGGRARTKKEKAHRDESRESRRKDSGKKRKHRGETKSVPISGRSFRGVDGEGVGRYPHRYVLLASRSEDPNDPGRCIENDQGLTTVDCLEFLLSEPDDAELFGFSTGYDLSKMLQDVDNETLYKLARPESRPASPTAENQQPIPVSWVAPNGKHYTLNLVGTKFTVTGERYKHSDEEWEKSKVVHLEIAEDFYRSRMFRETDGVESREKAWKEKNPFVPPEREKVKVTRTLWDGFRFFSSKFVAALGSWKVLPPELIEKMEKMKDSRSAFEALHKTAEGKEQIKRYCYDECGALGVLMRKLVDAAAEANLHLKAFHGAGSIASLIFENLEIRGKVDKKTGEILRIDKRGDGGPPQMQDAIARAFSGGRFENSIQGCVEAPIYAYDISSAYPYIICRLPCLACGHWTRTRDYKRMLASRTALVEYALGAPKKGQGTSWGPFPFRLSEGNERGSICYPIESGGGWVCKDEFLVGEKYWPNVGFKSAWVYEGDCTCGNPYPFAPDGFDPEAQRGVPFYYRERCRIGKEGAGIIYKLGPNSIYGKLAQSIGVDPPFQCWIWADLITSGCRAMILEVIGMHKDRSNVLSIATDGIASLEDIEMPQPLDTGTGHCRNAKGQLVPLGGWERDVQPKGQFFVRSGLSFPNNPTDAELNKVKAKGVGRKHLLAHWKTVVDAYNAGKQKVTIEDNQLERFFGMKSSIKMLRIKPTSPCLHTKLAKSMNRPDTMTCQHCVQYLRAPYYGEWGKFPIEITFGARPKRDGIEPTGKGYDRMLTRRLPRNMQSAPYAKTVDLSPESKALREGYEKLWDQPDGLDDSEVVEDLDFDY